MIDKITHVNHYPRKLATCLRTFQPVKSLLSSLLQNVTSMKQFFIYTILRFPRIISSKSGWIIFYLGSSPLRPQ